MHSSHKYNSLTWPKNQPVLPIEVSNVQKFPPSMLATINSCEEDEAKTPNEEDKNQVLGGITQDGQYSWIAKKHTICVMGKKNASRQPVVYKFVRSVEQDYTITNCVGYNNTLIVGLKNDEGRGLVCLFNPLLSTIFKAVEIPFAVTAIEIISLKGGAVMASHILSKNLRWLFGIAAVGTIEGHTFLLDLRLDSDSALTNEENPLQIEIIQPNAQDVPSLREAIVEQDCHLAFELHRHCHDEGLFHYADPDDGIIDSYYPSDIHVTSLSFEPRCSSLFIGYSFGQFHIYNLVNMELLFSSELSNSQPISRFAFQEPENDPKNFCYLWVTHGSASLQETKSSLSISMFQLMFAEKNVLPNTTHNTNSLLSKKVLYQGLELCHLRFEEHLGEYCNSKCNLRLVACQAVEKYHKDANFNQSMEEDTCINPESSLCMVIWEVVDESSNTQKAAINMLLFDINRWYLAHMPMGLTGYKDDLIYTAYWSVESSHLEPVLSVSATDISLVQRFFYTNRPAPEQFLIPSAITSTCDVLLTDSNLKFTSHGSQNRALKLLNDEKEFCLQEPGHVFERFLSVGLINSFLTNPDLSVNNKREAVLTACLEHNATNFLVSMMQNLSTGQYAASGCTLRMFYDWMWKSVEDIKEQINELCVPIFDCSSNILDLNTIAQFDMCTTQIMHLKFLFKLLNSLSNDVTEKGKDDLETKVLVVTLIHDYITVIRWFISNGLLPEQFAGEDEEHLMHKGGIIIYKYENLRAIFQERRNELSKLTEDKLLIIDGMMREIGEELTEKWQQEGGEAQYPPPSLMDLINIYYMDTADIVNKHCVVIYFLLDLLAMCESCRDLQLDGDKSEQDVEQLARIGLFPGSFEIPMPLVKLIQGFWYLDHKDYDQSLITFLASGTAEPYSDWQERLVLMSYMEQGCYNHALRYLIYRENKSTTFSDPKLFVTVYMKNNNLLGAWNIALSMLKDEELFSHFMLLCEENEFVEELLKLPLNNEEENAILKYLKNSRKSESQHLMILYYFKRGRYVDGIKAYNHINISYVMGTNIDKYKKQHSTLQKIVRAYSTILPRVERDRAFSDKRVMKHSVVKKEIYKVKPVQMQLHHASTSSPLTQATFLSKKFIQRNDSPQVDMTPFRKRPNLFSKVQEKIKDPKVQKKETIKTQKISRLSLNSMLLQTPPLARTRRRSRLSTQGSCLEISTPQSILKRKNFIKINHAEPLQQTRELKSLNEDNNQVLLIEDSGIENKDDSLELSPTKKRLTEWVSSTVKHTGSSEQQESSNTKSKSTNSLLSGELLAISTPIQKTRTKRITFDIQEDEDKSPQRSFHKPVVQTPKHLRFNLTSKENQNGEEESFTFETTVNTTVPPEELKGNLTPVMVTTENKENQEEMDVDVTGSSLCSEDDSEIVFNLNKPEKDELTKQEDEEDIKSDENTEPEIKLNSQTDDFASPPQQDVENDVIVLLSSDEDSKDSENSLQEVQLDIKKENVNANISGSISEIDSSFSSVKYEDTESSPEVEEEKVSTEPAIQKNVEFESVVEKNSEPEDKIQTLKNKNENDNLVESTSLLVKEQQKEEEDNSLISNEEQNILYISCTSESTVDTEAAGENKNKLNWIQDDDKANDSVDMIPATSASDDELLTKDTNPVLTQSMEADKSAIFGSLHLSIASEISEDNDLDIDQITKDPVEISPIEKTLNISPSETPLQSLEDVANDKKTSVSTGNEENASENKVNASDMSKEKISISEVESYTEEDLSQNIADKPVNSVKGDIIDDPDLDSEVSNMEEIPVKKVLSDTKDDIKKADEEIQAKVEGHLKEEKVVDSNIKICVTTDKSEDYLKLENEDIVVEQKSIKTVEKLKQDPTFVLSPPRTRNLRSRSSVSSEQKSRLIKKAETLEPKFVFSPPTTRKRNTKKQDESEMSAGVLDTSASSVLSVNLRRSTRTPKTRSTKKSVPVTPSRSSSRLRNKKAIISETISPRKTSASVTKKNKTSKIVPVSLEENSEKNLSPSKTPSKDDEKIMLTRSQTPSPSPRARTTTKSPSRGKSETRSPSHSMMTRSRTPSPQKQATNNNNKTKKKSVPKQPTKKSLSPKKLSVSSPKKLQPSTPSPQKRKSEVPLRRTPSRKAKRQSVYSSSDVFESTDYNTEGYGSSTDAGSELSIKEEATAPVRKTRTRKSSSTQTKKSSRVLRNRKMLHSRDSWSPGKEEINLLPVISENETQVVNQIAKVKRSPKNKNSQPPKTYPKRTRRQTKVYSINA